jgi:hypothetical protein
MDEIDMAQDSDRRRALANAVMNLQVSIIAEYCFEPVTFLGRILFNGVIKKGM